jgi:hypothetical protein
MSKGALPPDPRHIDFLRDVAAMVARELYAKRVQRAAGDPEATVDPSRRPDHSEEACSAKRKKRTTRLTR